jgi:inositol phosphorylceramide mannosyltransferase catalytic subunit
VKIVIHKSIFFCLLCASNIIGAQELLYLNFDTSMQIEQYQHDVHGPQTYQNVGVPGDRLLAFFRSLYEKNNFMMLHPSQKPRIPKIVHQIWIGDKVPEKFKRFQQSWLKHHPDWEYRLWTQDDIESFGFHNVELIHASRNAGEMSDIMRYEILYRHGGVYVDFDFECLRPLDQLNHLYDFYIGIQPFDCGFVQLGIGLIGSIPGHPMLRHAIDSMKESWDMPGNRKNPPKRTGPIFFTRSFFACAGKSGLIDVALPVLYLYPLGCKAFEMKYEQWLEHGSLAVHHWAGSWLRPQFRRPEFRELN